MKIPMFPLGTVLIPGQLLPLHIFEPRYLRMIRDVEEHDSPIFGIVLIERGSEVGGEDVRLNVGTCARILRTQQIDDGRFAIIVGGSNRIRVRNWLVDDPYPRADVEGLDENESGVDDDAVASLIKIHRRVAAMATEFGIGQFEASKPVSDSASLAVWTMIAESPIGTLDRQKLLETEALSQRMQLFGSMLLELESTLLMELQRNAD